MEKYKQTRFVFLCW